MGCFAFCFLRSPCYLPWTIKAEELLKLSGFAFDGYWYRLGNGFAESAGNRNRGCFPFVRRDPAAYRFLFKTQDKKQLIVANSIVMNTESIREVCLQLPAAKEEIKWENDLVFTVGGKMFCVTSFEQPFKASFKVPDELFEELCNREGFIPAPYLARAKWVLVSNEAGLTKQEWQQFVQESYTLVKQKLTKKQQKELGL